MTLIEAVQILDYHQQWRLGKVQDMFYTPKQLTKAINVVLKRIKEDETFNTSLSAETN